MATRNTTPIAQLPIPAWARQALINEGIETVWYTSHMDYEHLASLVGDEAAQLAAPYLNLQ